MFTSDNIKITIILGKHLDKWLLVFLSLTYSKSRNLLSNILWKTKTRNISISKGSIVGAYKIKGKMILTK